MQFQGGAEEGTQIVKSCALNLGRGGNKGPALLKGEWSRPTLRKKRIQLYYVAVERTR